MNFSTLFRIKENLNLDKNTLTILRYIAIFGQFLAINIVYFYLGLPFPIELSYAIIFLGLLTNIYLQFGIKINQLKDFYSLIFLIYDLVQLSILLYLTGGIFNILFSTYNTSNCVFYILKYGVNNYFRNYLFITFIIYLIFLSSFTWRGHGVITFS